MDPGLAKGLPGRHEGWNMIKNLVIIGKCGRPYGVRGWFHVQSFTEEPTNILNYQHWVLLTPQGKQKPVKLEGLREHGNHFVAKVEGIDTPEDAKLIGLHQIAMSREDLPELEDDQYYWADLTGLKAVLPNGKELGVVDNLFETGANDVIVVKTPNDEELLVPYIDSVVLAVDMEAGTMTMDWDPAERTPHDK